MDLLTLTNSSVNFLLFCLMSSQFRENLKQILKPHPHNEPSSRYLHASHEIEVDLIKQRFIILNENVQNFPLVTLNNKQDNNVNQEVSENA